MHLSNLSCVAIVNKRPTEPYRMVRMFCSILFVFEQCCSAIQWHLLRLQHCVLYVNQFRLLCREDKSKVVEKVVKRHSLWKWKELMRLQHCSNRAWIGHDKLEVSEVLCAGGIMGEHLTPALMWAGSQQLQWWTVNMRLIPPHAGQSSMHEVHGVKLLNCCLCTSSSQCKYHYDCVIVLFQTK